MPKRRKTEECEILMQGIGVSPGVVAAPVFLVRREDDAFVERDIAAEDVVREIMRFEDAVIQTRREIKQIQDNLGRAVGKADASIFDVHLMVLDDRAWVEEILKEIDRMRKNAETVVKAVTHRYVEVLSKVEDEYLRERVADVRDVARRILHNLSGTHGSPLQDLDSRSVVVANDLAPSETAVLRKDLVAGFATDLGSPISHTAIMARALKIPAVVGLSDVSSRMPMGEEVLIDGTKGILILHPSAQRMKEYGRLIEARESIETGLADLRDKPSETRDGHRIVLSANIEMVEEIDEIEEHGAEGVGLFRSEYLYLSRKSLPSEDDQFRAYDAVAARLDPRTVVIRTMDLGGDKLAPYLPIPSEINPFMGFRAIRFCLAQPEIFKVQLRAILRASTRGNVKLMYPMISNVDEVVRANQCLNEAMSELRARGVPFDESIEAGVMIETPSAALTADTMAANAKFFSLGTNDLVQYTLAVDRVNDRVAHLYEPTHPAVLSLIAHTIRAGHERGLHVAVCGAMAGDPVMAPLLIGLGIDELSMAPSAIPVVKDCIRSITRAEAEEVAAAAMKSHSGAEALRLCRELTRKAAPEILELVG